MNIYFVRHAQSESNIDPNILQMQTNMAVKLSSVGIEQAQESGLFVADHMTMPNTEGVKVWNSPYTRTRQTAADIKDALTVRRIQYVEEESIYLAERQFGLVDDVKDYGRHFEHEAKHYALHKEHKHDFFARPPLGESPFDMCIRLDTFLRTVLAQESHIKNHIIVSHGAAIRGLIMMYNKDSYETYTSLNPPNASVRLVKDGVYKGEIFVPTKVTA